MRYTQSYVLHGSLDEVIASAMRRAENSRVHPNVLSLRQVRWDETDSEIHCEYLARGAADIPETVRNLISPKMLSWREIGRWNKHTRTYEYHVKTFYFSNAFHMSGVFQFVEESPRRVRVDMQGDIRVDLPLVSGLIERTVVRHQLANIARETDHFNRGIMPQACVS